MLEPLVTVIVGNGPAGISAVSELRNVPTVWLAPEIQPCPGVCGGVLSPPSCDFLRRRNLLEPCLREGGQTLEQILICNGGKLLVRHTVSPGTFVSMDRSRLDRFLMRRLLSSEPPRKQGYVARVTLQHDHVELRLRTGEMLTASGVVDATGHRRLLASKTEPDRSQSQIVGLEWTIPRRTLETNSLVLVLFRGGYAGLAPGGKSSCTVSAVVTTSRFQRTGCGGCWDRLRESLPDGIRDALPVRTGEPRVKAGFWKVTPRPAHRRWVAVGDAAGFTTPLTGEGIWMALREGTLAGRYLQRKEARHTDRPAWPLSPREQDELNRRLQGPFQKNLLRWRLTHFLGMRSRLVQVLQLLAPGLIPWLMDRLFPHPGHWPSAKVNGPEGVPLYEGTDDRFRRDDS